MGAQGVRSPALSVGVAQAWPAPGGVWGRARAATRLAAVLAFTAVCAVVQAVCLVLPGRAKVGFARLYWAGMSRLMGVRVRVLGADAGREPNGRRVVYAANHTSWLDVLVLGGVLEACFVAKAEVSGWPLIRTVARLGRTVFVSRRARDTGRERDGMRERLRFGDNLILFPEGTSSDGSRVLPFRSAFFSITEGGGADGPVIQPVSVVYDRLGGLPIGRASRAVFAWYGDMELGPHVWRLARERGLRATVVLHSPIDAAAYASRKAVAGAVWNVVAAGAGALRQNRAAPEGPSVSVAGTAFA